MSRRCAAALAAALMLLAPATSALAATCPRTSLADLENEVMCLVCGVPLALADAPQAERERAFVRSMIRRCSSKDGADLTGGARKRPARPRSGSPC